MPELDRSVAVLIVKIGRYPLHHGGLGAIRTLGRLGVPVHAITEDRFTPAALSRYLHRRFVWPTNGTEDPAGLVEGLLEIGRRIGGRVIALPTDDEAAVLLAEHRDALTEQFVLPKVPPDLPRRLADKLTLYKLCLANGVPAAVSAKPGSLEELLRVAEEIGYPVVLKNAEPWARLRAPAVAGTTVVASEPEMRSLAGAWSAMPQVLVQEYLPDRHGAQDWIAQAYCDTASDSIVAFSGVKVRSWPPHAGVTTRAYATANEELVESTTLLCRDIGYSGIIDLDWRFDPMDGRYKLLDFNPRVGAQFRLFETDAGIDVVRALHLDLSGRPVPPGRQVDGRSLRVENLDLPAAWAYGRQSWRRPPGVPRGVTELAWAATDDLLPAMVAAARSGAPAAGMLGRTLRAGWARYPGWKR